MPLLRRKVATLDNRFVKIEEFKGAAFDLGLNFTSGMPKVTLPVNQTAHMNRFWGHGWQTSSTIRLGMNERGVWIELIFEKERPELQTEGKVIGINRGFRKAIVTSDVCLRRPGVTKAKKASLPSPPSGALRRIGSVADEERS